MDGSLHDSHMVGELTCENTYGFVKQSWSNWGSLLLVSEERMLQVWLRTDGAHKLVEDIARRTQLEEGKISTIESVTSFQLCIIE